MRRKCHIVAGDDIQENRLILLRDHEIVFGHGTAHEIICIDGGLLPHMLESIADVLKFL